MRLPLGFYDISLWLAITAIILLATSEIISPYYGQTGLIIEKGRLRTVTLILGFLFLSTVAVRIYQIIITL
ncbi:hypothetical protein KAR91_51530 [Candidatus Pacearchaeota archaeon]|nr:hypothetical protein [Candidatus Pacearchaeota archaeon]